ncbi:MAG: biopolymer transporter ExbD [Planctomycetales bacterium]|jgi:biopolymer transport protein ExbD|nr:biopolymer transporter ExbD [Planctomycetales bacterium]
MRLPSANANRELQFNITPLIDVVFLLIIFFLVASHFIRHEQLENVELPTATQGRDQQDTTSRVVVTVATDRRLRLGAQEASIDEIEKQLLLMAEEHGANSTELRIRIDRNLPYSVVEPLLLSAAQSGIKKVRFAVLPRL